MADEKNTDKNNPASEGVTPSNDDILKQLGSDYADYMKLDIKKESTEFEESLEEMLTRLDEFCGLVDIIRSDTNLCLGRTLPTIHKKCLEMEKMFDKIDQLEAFVRVVSQDVSVIERQVEEAEDEMGSLSGIKKVFRSLSIPPFLSKKQPEKKSAVASKQKKYIPPEIFRTDIYLHSDSPVMSGAISTPHVPVIPAVPPGELLAGSSGSTSGVDKIGATSKSGAVQKSPLSKVDVEPVHVDSSVHSNQDVTSQASSGDAPARDSNEMDADQGKTLKSTPTSNSSTDGKPEHTTNANSNNNSISANQNQGTSAAETQ